MIAYARERGIGVETLRKMGVIGAIAQLGDVKEKSIIFQYFNEAGEVVNYKARALARKAYKQKKGGEQIPYNWGNVVSGGSDTLIIVEGEFDVAALVEAGVSEFDVTSPPGGAPSEESKNPWEGKAYGWLIDNLEFLKGKKRYIIATDNDAPGRALRQDLVTILGKAKSFYVDWPEGVKDANEYMLAHGKPALLDAIRSAKQWPVSGIFTLADVPEPPEFICWDTGWPQIESKIRIGRGLLSVVTGYPGHGKSAKMLQMWSQIARRDHVRVALFSGETGIKPHGRAHLRQFRLGKLERDMTEAEKATADRFISDAFRFIDPGDEDMTFDWVLDRIEVAAHRHGCQAFIVDPWNYIEEDFDRRDMTETQWIGRCLKQLRMAAKGLDVHIQVIAHPTKPPPEAKKYPPDLYSISGSQHWFNRVDQGFVVHRQKMHDENGRCTTSELYCKKARFPALGYPCVIPMEYSLKTGCYVVTEYETEMEAEMRR